MSLPVCPRCDSAVEMTRHEGVAAPGVTLDCTHCDYSWCASCGHEAAVCVEVGCRTGAAGRRGDVFGTREGRRLAWAGALGVLVSGAAGWVGTTLPAAADPGLVFTSGILLGLVLGSVIAIAVVGRVLASWRRG